MSKRSQNILAAIVILGLATLACNMPAIKGSAPSNDVGGAAPPPVEAVEVIASATSTETPTATPTVTPSPTPCNPSVTANTAVNIRSGPNTLFDVIGNLPVGGSALVAGRNDDNTWWYIQFPGGYGGYAWIAASVVTPACIPQVLPVVAGPPLPVAPEPTDTPKLLLVQPYLHLHLAPTATPKWHLLQPFPQLNP